MGDCYRTPSQTKGVLDHHYKNEIYRCLHYEHNLITQTQVDMFSKMSVITDTAESFGW